MELMENIDWSLLRAQKQWLLSQDHEHAHGLLHLLDAIQDDAIRQGFEEDVVFGQSELPEELGEPCQCSEEQRRQCRLEI